jgi:Stage II sporulation protein E (SpoIIE)
MPLACGTGPVAVRCEPLDGPGSGALVIARGASPGSGPGWLSDAAARIGTTLDLSATAREVAEVAVPAFADAAAVLVAERLLAADDPASYQAGPVAVVRRLAARLGGQGAGTGGLLRPDEVLVLGADSPSLRAMQAGSPVLSGRLDPETAGRIAGRLGGRELTSRCASLLAVPLTARGVVLGCVTFGRAAARPGFGPGDVAAAGELASRAAACIDNARLYHREQRTAFALQRGLLPGEPRVPAGLEVARRYLPVGASVVGGDWHDIVELPGGRAAVIVGDVMGHGPEAAAVMVQLRTAAHVLADLDLPPAEVLRRLDQMAAAMPAAAFATCIYTVIDTAGNRCVIAAAGHPPPVLALTGGATIVPGLPPGLPLGLGLGAGTGSFEVTEVSLPPGATLATRSALPWPARAPPWTAPARPSPGRCGSAARTTSPSSSPASASKDPFTASAGQLSGPAVSRPGPREARPGCTRGTAASVSAFARTSAWLAASRGPAECRAAGNARAARHERADGRRGPAAAGVRSGPPGWHRGRAARCLR